MSRRGELAETSRQWATQYLLWSSSTSDSSLMLKSVIISCNTGGGSIGLLSLPSGPALAARGCWRICNLNREPYVELVDLVEDNGAGWAKVGMLAVVGVEMFDGDLDRYALCSLISPVTTA